MVFPFRTVGRCLYCDSTTPPLTREHVIPRGIGGNWRPKQRHEAMVLLKASCEVCREITRKFEDDCLNRAFGPARAKLNLNRKDRQRPQREAHVFYRDGSVEKRDVEIENIPGALVVPEMETAGIFCGPGWRPPEGTSFYEIVMDEEPIQVPKISYVAVMLKIDLSYFARMLCKIALGVAHYSLGPDAFTPITRDFIRKGHVHHNYFVGGFADVGGAPEALPNMFNIIALWHCQGLLVATIHLFAQMKAPVNYAVIGPLRNMSPGLPQLHLRPPP